MLPLPCIRVPCFGRSWTIWKHKEGRPRPPRRLFETGACAQCRMKNVEYAVPRQMPLESKPLFNPEVLRQQVRLFNLPEQVVIWRPKLQHCAGLITSGRAAGFKETALLPDFLTDIFCGLLGYTGPAESPDTFTLSRERHVEVDGKAAPPSELTMDSTSPWYCAPALAPNSAQAICGGDFGSYPGSMGDVAQASLETKLAPSRHSAMTARKRGWERIRPIRLISRRARPEPKTICDPRRRTAPAFPRSKYSCMAARTAS